MTRVLLAVLLLASVVDADVTPCNSTAEVTGPATAEPDYNNSQTPCDLKIYRTIFTLYTRGSSPQELSTNEFDKIRAKWSNFRIRRTIVLVHGTFNPPYVTTYLTVMKDELLKNGDYNVIIMDYSLWFVGFVRIPYTIISTAGCQLSTLMKLLMKLTGITADDFHLIGQNLGAHIVGKAGELMNGTVGRLTGLATGGGIFFEGAPPGIVLDPTDAIFVDSINTDDETLGIDAVVSTKKKVGHSNFYPNGGHDQPGCKDPAIAVKAILTGEKLDPVTDGPLCSQYRAVSLYIASINECNSPAIPCDSEKNFKSNTCPNFTAKDINYMGWHATYKGPNNSYFLSTGSEPPYC